MLKIRVEEKKIKNIPAKDLLDGWDTLVYKNNVRKFGTSLFSKNDLLGFWVPSVVIPEEHNIVLNPMFPNYYDLVTLEETYPFNYDERFRKFFKDRS